MSGKALAPPSSGASSAAATTMIDTGVYRYERNRRSHEFFSPGPHKCDFLVARLSERCLAD